MSLSLFWRAKRSNSIAVSKAATAAGGTGLLQGLLFEVQPLNLGTYIGTALVLLLAAAAASYFPALSVTGIDPLEAVRADQ